MKVLVTLPNGRTTYCVECYQKAAIGREVLEKVLAITLKLKSPNQSISIFPETPAHNEREFNNIMRGNATVIFIYYSDDDDGRRRRVQLHLIIVCGILCENMARGNQQSEIENVWHGLTWAANS